MPGWAMGLSQIFGRNRNDLLARLFGLQKVNKA
ncbi:MAG: hypothetical protein JWM58_4643 [Rhizobium sp.]|nr:hypothetical protein [Rhizobium sp.]